MSKMKIAVVGATGMVGRMFLRVLEERSVEADYTLFASKRSAGETLLFFGKDHTVCELTEESFKDQNFRGRIDQRTLCSACCKGRNDRDR